MPWFTITLKKSFDLSIQLPLISSQTSDGITKYSATPVQRGLLTTLIAPREKRDTSFQLASMSSQIQKLLPLLY
jgi:hypothetical protein